jgi:hypothetical protein
LLTINRRLAQQLRSVLRRTFGNRGTGPAVCFTAAAGTLSVKAKLADIAVEYRAPHAEEQLWLPLRLPA